MNVTTCISTVQYTIAIFYYGQGAVVAVFVWLLELQLPMQSVPNTTNVLISNPTQARCTG